MCGMHTRAHQASTFCSVNWQDHRPAHLVPGGSTKFPVRGAIERLVHPGVHHARQKRDIAKTGKKRD